MSKKKIVVEGSEITLLAINQKEDYISLTDIMKTFDDEFAIYSWMRNKNTVEFIGVWEQLHNLNFKGDEFVTFKNQAGSNNFNLTPKKWIEATNAIGIVMKAGRYGGGTFAHRDIAIHFCSWLNPTFQLYLIKEFQRLKSEEAAEQQKQLDWNLKRTLSKLNYKVHTDAIKNYLIPPKLSATNMESLYYASEADVLNLALFGITAKAWRAQNQSIKGNLRDNATTEQLLVLSNLENLNAEFIKFGLSKEERLQRLNEIAIHQMRLFVNVEDDLKKLDSTDTVTLLIE